jgi:hypothetical protein
MKTWYREKNSNLVNGTNPLTTAENPNPRHHILRPHSHVPVFDRPGANRMGESTTWNFVHTSWF